ncbi:diacylglycerol/lipid kinase family protein [Sphaerisporangium aureirubrum]|uniref:Diacylglycerol/lipid kinase family protein n=1 Tax=Sphaerisporangium aureirubrum TaxID=1544736 RepID=A0ABW1NT60_9ACTN
MPRAAIIVNPLKMPERDRHRADVTAELARYGWDEPLWFETTAEDPGVGMTKRALAEEADLVFAAGGDGTVRACAEALMGTGVPLALLCGGTGNLLARNLDIPIELPDAIRVGVLGGTTPVDVGVMEGTPFVVMAGLGLDAAMARGTGSEAKRSLGWLAYAGTLLRHLRDRPFRVTLHVDGRPQPRCRARMVLVGNVGRLQGGMSLLPDAQPSDGLLDVVVLGPRTPMDWLRVLGRLVTRSRGEGAGTRRYVASRLRIEVDPPTPYECDGDPVGSARVLTVEIKPGALSLRTPGGEEG